MKLKKTIIISTLLFITCSLLFSHGVIFKKIQGGIGIEAKYANKTPISFSDITIYQPNGKKFIKSITDKNGRFLFFPDKKGKWKIIVNDGMGHGLTTEININKNMKNVDFQSAHFSVWQKILIGLSFIFGLTGILSFYTIKKNKGI